MFLVGRTGARNPACCCVYVTVRQVEQVSDPTRKDMLTDPDIGQFVEGDNAMPTGRLGDNED
jgi:hypothetical protein